MKRYPASENFGRILFFDQQKRQNVVLPFYLTCFSHLSLVRMHQLIGGSGDYWPISKFIIVEAKSASGNKMGPDDMEIIFYICLLVAAINESKDESLFFLNFTWLAFLC
jgi:hypothetical protein